MSAFRFHEADPTNVRNFRPLNKNLLTLLDITKQCSKSGLILIPTSCQQEQATGVVVAMDPDIDPAFGITVGTRVLLDQASGVLIHDNTRNKRKFVCYNVTEITATMED
jgi:co-chaperonin GroES (HSP10)